MKPKWKFSRPVKASLIGLGILLLCCIPHFFTPSSSADEKGVFIGVHSPGAGDRDAMSRIASDMQRYPRSQQFVVRWSASRWAWLHLDDIFDRHVLVYHRNRHSLVHSDAGGEDGWTGVSDAMIVRIARVHGEMDDLKQFGCESWP